MEKECIKCKYKMMVDEANKYKEENRNYQQTCDDNKILRLILGCQTIEVRGMRIDLTDFKKRKFKEIIEAISNIIEGVK
ncbi:MAG TPA: hypothetical protein ENH82_17200 [bacterium]|nr:hypothetical protein [bacterium]